VGASVGGVGGGGGWGGLDEESRRQNEVRVRHALLGLLRSLLHACPLQVCWRMLAYADVC
jgi:hypothetical protein